MCATMHANSELDNIENGIIHETKRQIIKLVIKKFKRTHAILSNTITTPSPKEKKLIPTHESALDQVMSFSNIQ